MTEYKVYNPDIDNYGIYDYFNLKGYHKSLGIILDNEYIFKIDISDHYTSHVEYKEEYGPYNLWICADSDYLGIQYNYDDSDINEFQYKCILKILDECKRYINETNKKINVDVSDVIFNNKDLVNNPYNIDAIIEDIETKYNTLFGKKM